MRTKALSTAKRVQPRFIEPMYAEGHRYRLAGTAVDRPVTSQRS